MSCQLLQQTQSCWMQLMSTDKEAREIFSIYLSYWIYQDQIYWRSIGIIIAIQGAAIAAGYATRAIWIGPTVMFAAAAFVLVCGLSSFNVRQNRDANLKIMNFLSNKILPRDIEDEVRKINIDKPYFKFRHQWSSIGNKIMRGRVFQMYIFVIMLIIDISLGFLYYFNALQS